MSRLIKFRCYVHAFKEMYWFDIMNGNRHGTGSGYISMTPVGEPITKGLHKDNMIPIDPTENPIMQYTGLKDKNGVEIYEGDICKIISTGKIKEVIYHKCAFGIDLGNSVFAPIYWHDDIEVIGNIYQTPELIKHT